MTKKNLAAVLALPLLLAACGGSRITPDEFEVVGRAPLTVPPESTLAPPRPGEPRAQRIDPGRQAFEALFPGQPYRRAQPASEGERDLLSRLYPSDPDVRSNVAQKELDVVKKRLILAEILDADEREYRPDNVSIRRVSGAQ